MTDNSSTTTLVANDPRTFALVRRSITLREERLATRLYVKGQPGEKRAARSARLASVLRGNLASLRPMMTWDLLAWAMCATKRRTLMGRIQASEYRLVGELTDRQRNLLCDALEGKS